jgi:hypothetical protein
VVSRARFLGDRLDLLGDAQVVLQVAVGETRHRGADATLAELASTRLWGLLVMR